MTYLILGLLLYVLFMLGLSSFLSINKHPNNDNYQELPMKYYLIKRGNNPETIEAHEKYPELSSGGSISGGYSTKEELIEKQQILPDPCTECSGLVSTTYVEETKKELTERNLCFNCNFWTNILTNRESHVFIDGKCYYISPDSNDPNSWKGFGGSEFKIRFPDGRVVISHNLWHQGSIPEHFLDRLPNTAQFIR